MNEVFKHTEITRNLEREVLGEFVRLEAFEKWLLETCGGKVGFTSRELLWMKKAWQAAEAEMQKPQTAETCQAVPPHRKGCLVATTFGAVDAEGPTVYKLVPDQYVCLACEALKQVESDSVLIERMTSLLIRYRDAIWQATTKAESEKWNAPVGGTCPLQHAGQWKEKP
jgi:hypothetical protein